MGSVRTDTALILPISDLSLSRDVDRKFRLAGIVTAVSPSDSSLVVLSDPYPASDGCAGSILVDLSLCIDQSQDGSKGGWGRTTPQVVPPELKCKCMVIGHLTRLPLPMDITFALRQSHIDLGQVQLHHAVHLMRQKWASSLNRYFVLEATLIKPLDDEFDLQLWNRTARVRSHHLWSMHHQQQQQTLASSSSTSTIGSTATDDDTAAAPAQDSKGKRKAICID